MMLWEVSGCHLLGRGYKSPLCIELLVNKEYVAVLIEVYKKNVTVSCVGSDLLSEW